MVNVVRLADDDEMERTPAGGFRSVHDRTTSSSTEVRVHLCTTVNEEHFYRSSLSKGHAIDTLR